MQLRFLLQDTPQVHPCRLDGRIPAANGPVEEASIALLCRAKMVEL